MEPLKACPSGSLVREPPAGTSPLASYFSPRHLEQAALRRCRDAFLSHPARLLVIRPALRAEVARPIARFLAGQVAFARSYGLYSANGPVPEERWSAAAEDDRFFRFGICRDAHLQQRSGEGWRFYFGLRQAIRSGAVAGWCEAVTGGRLGPSTEPNVVAMQAGDFLRRHTDLGQRRRLAYVFYLSYGWQRAYGGVLQVVDAAGSVTRIEPAYNSLVLFDVTAQREHAVATVTAAAGRRVRLTVSGWFTDPE